MMSDWVVELVDDNISDMYVEFAGPKDSEWVKGTTGLSLRIGGVGGRGMDVLALRLQ